MLFRSSHSADRSDSDASARPAASIRVRVWTRGIGIVLGLAAAALAAVVINHQRAAAWPSRSEPVQHDEPIWSLAYSSDGATLATSDVGGTVRAWDLRQSRRLLSERPRGDHARRVAFSPDGRVLAASGWEPIVRFWDVAGREELHPLALDHGWTKDLAFSPDGRSLAVTSQVSGNLSVWDWTARPARMLFRVTDNDILAFAYSPDGSQIAIGGKDGSVRLREPATGREVGRFQAHERNITAIAFSPDSRVLATASQNDPDVRIWNPRTFQEQHALHGHQYAVLMAFAPGGRWLATWSANGLLRLWDADPGSSSPRYTRRTGWLQSLAFSADGKSLAVARYDGRLDLWNLRDLRSPSDPPASAD